jgi:hypothetical protein
MSIYSTERGGLTARIEYDSDPTSPSEWDNLGEIAYSSARYKLGTKNVSKARMDEIAADIRSGELVGMPVFSYVHSGATIRAAESNPFHDPWDSGQSGFVYADREKVLKEFGKSRMSVALRKRALETLKAEVETFDMYLRGDVYGVVIEDEAGRVIDSVWGMYGLEYAREELESMLVNALASREETVNEQLEAGAHA